MKKLIILALIAILSIGCDEDTPKEVAIEGENIDKEKQFKPIKRPVFAGGLLYKKCVGCHGLNGQKQALGKGQAIARQSIEELKQKITGYKNGNYGGVMKGLMKSQVSTLNKKQIEALAKYINAL
jgi:cytochrome c553